MNLAPWQVWWVEFDPIEGNEQAGRRPAVIVSSEFHLQMTGYRLVTVLPLTTRERPWPHRVEVRGGPKPSWVVTEQVRTISVRRLTGRAPAWTLSAADADEVRRILQLMIA
ncbi:MAG TPA: type II toxin-antitoxin system PemK/MazF family toxin [Actinoplanes sp.]|nr:type II toxin-antitoxin system PemK/MazF family toxin [Actinoplanes sp.]